MKLRLAVRPWPLNGCGNNVIAGTRGAARFLSSSRPLSRVPLDIPPPFPVAKEFPEPSCSCPPMPTMPEGLPIDYNQPLNGTMAAYAEQVVVCTGQRDWTSRIEDDGKAESWGGLVRGLKGLMGRGGRFADPFNNALISNSSFSPSPLSPPSSKTASAFLFPSFKYFPSIPIETSESPSATPDLSAFVRAFLLPTKLSAMAESLPPARRDELTRKPELAAEFPDAIDLQHSPVVLICGHGGRDMRCGVVAPILELQFQRVLQSKGLLTSDESDGSMIDSPSRAHVGLISHVGGHKYAGNVIVYIPPQMKYKRSSEPHPLAGKGIWYGRIEPQHVEGIVEETIMSGRVVTDHFRGGIDQNGDILRL